jgi:large subunit ribosomal protein L17
VVTTVAKAKELRSFAEQLITRARRAYSAERAGTVQGVDVHNRRMVGRYIKNKAVLQELFDTIAPMVVDRNGGYTRIIKLGQRRGDQAPEAVIELVDWSNPQDGRVSAKARKTRVKTEARKPAGAKAITEPEVAAAAAVAEAPAAEATAEEASAEVAQAEEASADVAPAEVASAEVAPAEEAQADEAPDADEEKPADNA